MDQSFSGSFYDDEGFDEGNVNDDEESGVNDNSDADEAALLLSEEEKQLQQKQKEAQQKQSAKELPHQQAFCFANEFTIYGTPKSQTTEMRRREQDWFLVIVRDLLALREQLKVPSDPATHGSYSAIDGTCFADSDALQTRMKRNCSVLTTAMKSADGDQSFSPKAVELIASALVPFVLSEETMFGCRSTWNTIISCLKNVMRRAKQPPKSAILLATGVEESSPTSPAVASPSAYEDAASPGLSVGSNLPLDVENGISLDWRPIFALSQKVVAASIIPGQSQAYSLLFNLIMAMNRCISSKSFSEIWKFTRRHFIGHITSSFAARLIPSRIFGRQNGAVDSESIKEQCDTLREMLDWVAASWKVPHPICNSEEILDSLAVNIFSPVGVRLFEKNREAFDLYVVPLRKRVLELLQPHLRINLGARKSSSGASVTTSVNGVKLLSQLIVRGEQLGWDELTRWRRVLEPHCGTKSSNSVAIRYISDVITAVSKETQKRLSIFRAHKKPLPPRETLLEIFPALEGKELQTFLSLTVPLVAGLAFNPRMFTNYSYAMWVLSFMDPTPSTAARVLASVQVGMSEAGKETKQVTQALKILSDQMCALSSQTLFTVASSSSEDNSIFGRQWPELLGDDVLSNLATHTTPGALQDATKELLAGATSPLECVKKSLIGFFYKALENLESTVEDRVNDALRCVYSLTIFGQCDDFSAQQRKELTRAFINKVEEKYAPVEANLSATTAGVLNYAFTGVFRLVSDDLEETLRIIQFVRDMIAKPSIHETWSTFLRTLIAGILEQGSTRLLARSLSKDGKTSDPSCFENVRRDHADLLPWFDPLIAQIFDAARVELANGLTTTSRFVGNVYVICTLLEHLPSPVLNQLCLERCKSFVSFTISWCQDRAADSEINEKAEADLRCAASCIQSILDCTIRSLVKPMPLDINLITLNGSKVWESSRDQILFIEPTHVEQRACRELVIFYHNEAKKQLSSIPEKANPLERAFRCAVVGRILGGCRGGCWSFNGFSRKFLKALDDEIAITKATLIKNSSAFSNKESNSAAEIVEILTTKSPEPSQKSLWWTARYYDIENVPLELCAPAASCTPGIERDLTDVDTEIYLWLIQEMLGQYCFVPSTSTSATEDSVPAVAESADAEPPAPKTVPRTVVGYSGKFREDHPLLKMNSLVEVDDVPHAAFKTVMSLLEGNYSFDYTSLLNEIVAPGDDAGRDLFHFRMSAARSFLKSRDRAGAFSRSSSDWSSRIEASVMLNLAFSKSVSMRQQAQAVVVGFINMWYQMEAQAPVIDEIVQSLKKRLGMGTSGWLAHLSDVSCKVALHFIVDLCGVVGRDHIFQLAEPLLSELCLGGKLRRPSNENRKEGVINALIGKLQSSSYGPPAAVCDKQVGRWLDLAMERGRAPIVITRCLRVALCYFRHLKKLNEHCSVNGNSRHECLTYITQDHCQFLLSLVTQLHRSTEYAWKILHIIGLVVAREMHFIHTHLPRKDVPECECCPVVGFYDKNRNLNASEKNPWIVIKGPNHAITDCCPFLSNYIQPDASCAHLYRKAYTWGRLKGHTAELATTLGNSFLRPEFVRQCLDVHVALLRSEAIAGERSGRQTAVQKVQSSPLANAIEWSRFGRCSLWAQLSSAYEKFVSASDDDSTAPSAQSECELEMKALHNLTSIWSKAIDGILPRFDASGAMRSPASSPQASPAISPALIGSKARSDVPELEQLDDGPAVGVAAAEKQGEGELQPSISSSTKKEVAPEDAAEPPMKKVHTTLFDDEGEKFNAATSSHADPESDAALKTKQEEQAAAAAAALAAQQQQQEKEKQQAQQTSVICEYLAGNALTRGLFPAVQHLAYAVYPSEIVVETRKRIIDLILALFRETMFVPAVPHEAAALFLNSWGGFAGALSVAEKIVIHKYLFSVVTMSSEDPAFSNELVRRRAWQAIRKSYGSPARGLWREALLLEDAFLLDQLLTKEIYNTAIEDSSRSVRAEANATFKGMLESSVVARIASFYDYTDPKGSAATFPVDQELLRSDQLTVSIEDTLLKLRVDTLQNDSNHQKRVRSALSLISLVTAGVALQSVIPQIANIATTLISVPSEAASAAQLTQLRRAPSDLKSVAEIMIGLLNAIINEVANLSANISSFAGLDGVPPQDAAVGSSPTATPTSVGGGQDSAASGRVALAMARVSPLIIYLRYLAMSRFACDISPLPGNILDITASAFTLPGRQLMIRVSQTLSTWAQILPRAEVRNFVVQTIKNLDAASKVKDSLTMKVGIASLSAVVNAFPQSIPAFVPACLMKLVKYKTAVTLTRDEIEEMKLKAQQVQRSDKNITNEDDDDSSSPSRSPMSSFGKTEDYKSIATEGLQAWWASHLEAWEQEHKVNFTEAQAQAIGDACKARSYFV